MIRRCIQCGTLYNFNKSKTDECWICGAPIEDDNTDGRMAEGSIED